MHKTKLVKTIIGYKRQLESSYGQKQTTFVDLVRSGSSRNQADNRSILHSFASKLWNLCDETYLH